MERYARREISLEEALDMMAAEQRPPAVHVDAGAIVDVILLAALVLMAALIFRNALA